ncbi:MAG: DNA-processing protein DprA [Lachnospiraceae bacterium]|nr:DNA-processing protein DprA [Lachnospiraceae bacterium]
MKNSDLDSFLKNEDDWLWLCAVPELDWKQKMMLLHYFGSPEAIRQAEKSEFNDWERVGIDWIRKLYACLHTGFLDEIKEQMEKKRVAFISRGHPAYPKRLRTICDAPYGLFYKGKLPESAPLYVGIVGARACSTYGSAMARQIAGGLAESGIHVVSGMAMGVDGISQKAAVEAGGTSFAVLGCGPDRCYPRMNIELYMSLQEKGGILSEYPCNTKAQAWYFPARNRIISGLSDILVVIEAGKRSGSLITAEHALYQGREVYAVPGRVNDPLSEGCNAPIRDGAGVIVSADLFTEMIRNLSNERYGPLQSETAGKKTDGTDEKRSFETPEEAVIYMKLGMLPVTPERLKAETGLSMAQVHRSLLRLQLADLASEIARNQFVKQK